MGDVWRVLQLADSAFPTRGFAHSVAALDARAESFLTNHVANRASRTQGRAFLDTCARIFPEPVGPLRQAARAAALRYHHAPSSARCCGPWTSSTWRRTWARTCR